MDAMRPTLKHPMVPEPLSTTASERAGSETPEAPPSAEQTEPENQAPTRPSMPTQEPADVSKQEQPESPGLPILKAHEPESSEDEGEDEDVPDFWVSNAARQSQMLNRHSRPDFDWDMQASETSGSIEEGSQSGGALGKLSASIFPNTEGDQHETVEPQPAERDAFLRPQDESASEYSQDESMDNSPMRVPPELPSTEEPVVRPTTPENSSASNPTASAPRDVEPPSEERSAARAPVPEHSTQPVPPVPVQPASEPKPPAPERPLRESSPAKQAVPSTPESATRTPVLSSQNATPKPPLNSDPAARREAPGSDTRGKSAAAVPGAEGPGAPPMRRIPSLTLSEQREEHGRSGSPPSVEPPPWGFSTPPRTQATMHGRSPRSGASPSLRSRRTPPRTGPEARTAVPKFLLDMNERSEDVPPRSRPPFTGMLGASQMQDDWLMGGESSSTGLDDPMPTPPRLSHARVPSASRAAHGWPSGEKRDTQPASVAQPTSGDSEPSIVSKGHEAAHEPGGVPQASLPEAREPASDTAEPNPAAASAAMAELAPSEATLEQTAMAEEQTADGKPPVSPAVMQAPGDVPVTVETLPAKGAAPMQGTALAEATVPEGGSASTEGAAPVGDTAPQATVPEDMAPQSTAPQSTVPEATAPQGTVPERLAPQGPAQGASPAAETTPAADVPPAAAAAPPSLPKAEPPSGVRAPSRAPRRSTSGAQGTRMPIPPVRSASGSQRERGHQKSLSEIMQEADAFLQEWKGQ